MSDAPRPQNFLAEIVEADLRAGRNGGRVVTRFPPEPNGFLHIGHAKSILLNFGLARAYGGRTHLRFDDTNPVTEETEYVEAIQADVRWLGCEWGEHLYYASGFFERMYECAERLVRDGKAYVDTQTQDEIREQRGSFERPGVNSPFRDRPPAESLDLLRRMRGGELPDGAAVLRARIDMAHPNVLLRDPLLYRIRHASHHRTGDTWCIYPMYDFAHPLEDAFEGVTHSICTLEFESNRELYDWVLDNLGPWDPRPRQYEFARLALGYTVLSKRKLLQLVNERRVAGWDDPRMPTIAGMRRRGVTPEALRDFAELIGVAKNNSVVDIGKLEFAIRADLEGRTPRALAVLNPLPLVVESWPADRTEELDVPWWPAEPQRGGSRKVPFGRELLIERDDFSEAPPKDWKRLAPGREVRLAGGYVVRCEGVVRDASGAIAAVRCTHDPASRGEGERRKVAGTIHWVHATRSAPAEVRLYDRLFGAEQPDAEPDFLAALNPRSLAVTAGARVEPALAAAASGTRWQFLRQGYFFVDPVDSRPGAPVFNRTITLKDTWAARSAAAKPVERRTRREPAPGARGDGGPTTAEQGAAARRSRADLRAEARAANPELAARHARYTGPLALPEEEADLLSGDPSLATWFDAALAVHPSARSVARWLLNDLLGAARDRALESLPLGPGAFGRLVALVDAGRLTPAAGKALLAELVEKGGEPEARMKALGLEKVEDRGAVEAAVARALEARRAEADRYRAGEKKLFGVLVGAAMRETGGAADAALVRQVLEEKLR
ncbi:glutamine--tRNA ligase/YqeY domain fusion protein [Anaeromyxobacter sp. Fw109-5]|uniref:glutamine--tRNA ligase/YqeY domain fusion protein n=1 Tax=Anaeromyxobacter sp. (strain Fw109-5) TaxID=404589 RepID=UPI0000ED809B|nr:glutamine--tRNA ligase/YqeY domain fusion protein [Anaeromyxobacter sp. Fw109-5]ABS25471.1 glutaminyl-tRNA synthetase [Anaeromyxobacter sp. Fw109-5]